MREKLLVTAGNDSIIPGNGGIEVYAESTGTWRSLRGQFLPLRPGVVVVDDAAYLFSTSLMDSFGLRLNLHDLSLESITLLNDRELPRLAVADHVICRANGRIFGEPTISGTVDLFDTLTGEWRESDLRHAEHLRAAASDRASGTAIFAGGGNTVGPPPWKHAGVDLIQADRSLHVVICTNDLPNSTGDVPSLQASGIRTAGVNLFALIAEKLPASCFGGALVSPSSSPAVVLGGAIGDLCLGTPRAFVQATPLRANAAGRLTVSMDLTALPFSPSVAVMPGETWYFQTWYRDRSPVGAVTRLTDAVSVQFE